MKAGLSHQVCVKAEKQESTSSARVNPGQVTSLETSAAEEFDSVAASNHCFHRRNQRLAGIAVFNCYMISSIIPVYPHPPSDMPHRCVALSFFV